MIPYNVIVENMNNDTTIHEWERKEQMKKQYVVPMADKVDFDYEENVVASGSQHECNCNWSDWYSNNYSSNYSSSFMAFIGKTWKFFMGLFGRH